MDDLQFFHIFFMHTFLHSRRRKKTTEQRNILLSRDPRHITFTLQCVQYSSLTHNCCKHTQIKHEIKKINRYNLFIYSPVSFFYYLSGYFFFYFYEWWFLILQAYYYFPWIVNEVIIITALSPSSSSWRTTCRKWQIVKNLLKGVSNRRRHMAKFMTFVIKNVQKIRVIR